VLSAVWKDCSASVFRVKLLNKKKKEQEQEEGKEEQDG
jgi:hypothetical protein